MRTLIEIAQLIFFTVLTISVMRVVENAEATSIDRLKVVQSSSTSEVLSPDRATCGIRLEDVQGSVQPSQCEKAACESLFVSQ